jgi:hypothetical protein
MQVSIELTEKSRELLMCHFPSGAPLHEALRDAARNHCPPAVKDIKHAVDAARRR